MTRRLVQLILGLSLYGAAVGVMVRAGLGPGPLVAIFLPLFDVNHRVQRPAVVNL